MAKGRMPGMGNMGSMMKQMQKMQHVMARLQGELEEKAVESSAGGGVVAVVAIFKKEHNRISITAEAVHSDDEEMLEDLILAAVNEALRKAEQMVAEEMSKITGGLNIPGL